MDRIRERSHRHHDRGWEGRRGGPNLAQRGHSACGRSRGDVCFQAPRCDNGYGVREKRQLGGEQRHCGGYDRDVPRDYKPGDSMGGRQVPTSHLSHFWGNRGHTPSKASPAVTHPNLSQPPPTYKGTAGTAGYQPYQAATAYSSLAAAPPPGTAQPPAAGSAYASAGGQPGSVSGGYAAAGGQAGAGYGANGGYSVAPGGQHWSRPPPATQNSGYYRR